MRTLLLLAVLTSALQADSGYDAWLRYEPITAKPVFDLYASLPATIVTLDSSPVTQSAQTELQRGVFGMLERHLRAASQPVPEDMFVLGTLPELKQAFPTLDLPEILPEDAFLLRVTAANAHKLIVIASSTDRGILYGTFELLRQVVLGRDLSFLNEQQSPFASVRWVNEWDNLDGSIERGYAGRSIFFDNGNVAEDLTRVSDYARLLASVGINGCTINNVNANPRILKPDFLPQLARIAAAMRPWGVRMSISVPFAAPTTAGGLQTFDPLDPKVRAWWKEQADDIYRAIPDLAGFVVKADSEGQAGPSTYNRTHADAVNVLAEALEPHRGILVYRGFVYNHHMDWRDLKNDRAKAAYEAFHPLDGKFAENAAIQIKYGPIDFQAREPVSPLIGSLPHTNEILELQITQEYTGQQRHLCYLVPMWKQVLDFDLHASGTASTVKEIVSGHTFNHRLGGFAGVSNVGLDTNWVGYDLAQANLYGYGRLTWNPDLSAEQITDEWTRMTWGQNERVVQVVSQLELASWRIYEGYTGPLGLGTVTDILHGHYGPGIETAERNGWGQWIRAGHDGIGMDRTVATGTGYVAQYAPPLAKEYEAPATTPDNLMLFMHHLPFTYILHSGQTIIQSVYDGHYWAAARAQEFPEWWKSLRGLVDQQRFNAVLSRLQYQAGHAIVWRDAICQWFAQMSGIPDDKDRVGHTPGRYEAEDMHLDGYTVVGINPREDASNGKAVSCPAERCTASFTYERQPGWFDVAVQYFDVKGGRAQFQLEVNGQMISDWKTTGDLPGGTPNGDTSTRVVVPGVGLRYGDRITITGHADGNNQAAFDYIELVPSKYNVSGEIDPLTRLAK